MYFGGAMKGSVERYRRLADLRAALQHVGRASTLCKVL
jgi:hypothetical protein